MYWGGAFEDKGIKQNLKAQPFHRLQVKLWPGRIQMYADDLLIHDDKRYAAKPSGQITIGQMVPAVYPNAFKCRNVRIRRLTDAPPPAD